jgi:hypothetical protein
VELRDPGVSTRRPVAQSPRPRERHLRRSILPTALALWAVWSSTPPAAAEDAGVLEPPRLRNDPAGQTDTIERVSGEDKGPRIPEPMVFDLVRPLGARTGEMEINTLGLIPLSRRSRGGVPDPVGLVPQKQDHPGIEWAPEIEMVLRDGVAVELELPMLDGEVAAYKAAGQVTFGTGFGNRFIHGAQAIVQYDLRPKLWLPTLLYVAGWRFDRTWSLLGMAGARGELDAAGSSHRAEMVANVALFADVTGRLVAGIEANAAQVVGRNAAVLVMPQLHYEVSRQWMIQGGFGADISRRHTVPTAGFRIIMEF